MATEDYINFDYEAWPQDEEVAKRGRLEEIRSIYHADVHRGYPARGARKPSLDDYDGNRD